jgi:hypothetical protein
MQGMFAPFLFNFVFLYRLVQDSGAPRLYVN